ncbi:MAG: globin [Chloroflexota bacterium]|nr:globin [Chloroflexota bacterium]MDE2909438.1 globin [Chloroflexota bacterium]
MSFKPQSVYDLVGGEEPLRSVVDQFYDKVEADPILRPMYPPELAEAKRRLFLFLVQFFGGPTRYSEERGHPRLRMRHFSFAIDRQARDHWLAHMRAAIDEAGIREPARSLMRDYFERSSAFLINRPDSIDIED